MKKRILSLLLASSVIVSLVGCSAGGNKTAETAKPAQTSGDAINFNEAPYTINLSYAVYGAAQPDLPKVLEKVNGITLKKINAKVEFKAVNITSLANTYSLAASSGEKSDLIMLLPGDKYFTSFVGSKMIKPIDAELEKWGKDIKATLGSALEVAKYQGKQYGIPAHDPVILAKGMWLLDSIVKKYNIDVTKIKTLDDMDPIFEKVKAGEPDMQIFFPNGSSFNLLSYDNLGSEFGVLANAGLGDLKIVNKFVTEEYKNLLKKMREWYLKGYIPKDYATAQVQPSSLQNANKLFAITNTMGFDKQGAGENPAKLDVRFVDGVKKTSDNQMFLWAVPSSAQRVDKSIQFLNLVFQDKELTKLLKYGIKGEHYDELNGGVLDVNKGLKTYRQAWPIWGNSVSLYAYEQARLGSFGGNPEKYKASEAQWIKDTKTSKAYGFIFNSDPVKTELAALNAVQEQYLKLLEGGAVDPEKELKNFNDKLYAAGLKKVMDEKQKQLDEWVKTKK